MTSEYEGGITLYDTKQVNDFKPGSVRVGSTRDKEGQKWYLYLVKGQDKKYHEILRSVYLHTIFDYHFKNSMITQSIPDELLRLAQMTTGRELVEDYFSDPKLDAKAQIEQETVLIKKLLGDELIIS